MTNGTNEVKHLLNDILLGADVHTLLEEYSKKWKEHKAWHRPSTEEQLYGAHTSKPFLSKYVRESEMKPKGILVESKDAPNPDQLLEGKAIRPSSSMVATAEQIADAIRKHFASYMSKAAPKGSLPIAQFLAELGRKVGGHYKMKTPYGKRSFFLQFVGADPTTWHRRATSAHKQVVRAVNPDVADADVDLKGDEWNLTITLGAETVAMLMARREMLARKTLEKSLLGPLKPADVKDYANILAKNLRSTLIHELVHISDPKLQPEFVTQQLTGRTRTPYTELNTVDPTSDDYFQLKHEQETWMRQIARDVIMAIGRLSMEQKGQLDNTFMRRLIRNPSSVSQYFTYSQSLLDAYRRHWSARFKGPNKPPNLWRRFLSTLYDEFTNFNWDHEIEWEEWQNRYVTANDGWRDLMRKFTTRLDAELRKHKPH